MGKPKTRLILMAAAGLGLIVLLLWMPKVPASKRAEAEKPVNADSLKLAQAVELVQSENPMQGIQMLLEMVKEDSTNIEAQMYLADFAMQSGQVDKAIQRLDLITRIKPDFARAHFDKGYVLMQVDSLGMAIESFRKGLALEPENLNGLFFTAQCNEALENWSEAKDYYTKVLELNTDTLIERKVNEIVQNIEKNLNP